MKKRKLRFVLGLMILSICLCSGSTVAYAASYNRSGAVQYANLFATQPNTNQYKTLDSDCTNFASQVAKAGGIPAKIHYNHGLKASALKNWVLDESTAYWYHIKETQKILGINKTVYVYSKPWAFVGNFRNYMSNNKYATVKNVASTKSAIVNAASLGDVVQAGDTHSVVITGNGVYSAHSSNASKADLQKFVDFAKSKGLQIRVIHFTY